MIGQISKSISIEESQFIKELENIGVSAVTLTHCLRNQSDIFELAKPKLGALSHFKKDVKVNKALGYIDRFISKSSQIHSNPLNAVKEALHSQKLQIFTYMIH